jgi:hypothetical protein
MRKLDVDERRAARDQRVERGPQCAGNFFVDAAVEQPGRDPDAGPTHLARQARAVIRHRFRSARGVGRIGAGDHRQRDRRVAGRARQRTDLIEGRGEGEQSIA